jgi:hypothetical protein
MKSSAYRYARRQVRREFNRNYYSYGKSRNNNTKSYAHSKNVEVSDSDMIIGICVVIGFLMFIGFAFSL